MSKECLQNEEPNSKPSEANAVHKREYVWRNIILMALLHIFAIYGIHLAIFKAKLNTLVFFHIISILSSMGVQVCCSFKLIKQNKHYLNCDYEGRKTI